MQKVFVYGTLKQGEPNHYWLQNKKNGVGNYWKQGITKNKYPLIIATKYNIPFLLQAPEFGHQVHGEVYEVDDRMLRNLDIFKDHPNFYIRKKEEILVSQELQKISSSNFHSIEDIPALIQCWVYFLKNFKPELMQKQRYKSYNSTAPHGLVYMDRSKRDSSYDYKNEIKPDKI